MKIKPRWMKSVIATAKKQLPTMPFQRSGAIENIPVKPAFSDHA
jgi:hypothetical protein